MADPSSTPLTIPDVPGPTSGAWRETALARATELRGRLNETLAACPADDERRPVAEEVLAHVQAAEEAASGRRADGGPVGWLRFRIATVTGASVERASSQLDAAEAGLLRLAPATYVIGQLPAIVARGRAHLPADDPRLQRLARLANEYALEPPPADPEAERSPPAAPAAPAAPDPALAAPAAPILLPVDREAIIATLRATTLEERREVARVRSFRNVLLCAALALSLCVGGLLVVGIVEPRALPLCFTPNNAVVCPTHTADATKGVASTATPATTAVPATGAGAGAAATTDTPQDTERIDRAMRDTASGWDIAVVMLVGLVAAAVASAVALRTAEGTSTPYSLPTALAVLKLPTGALTAVLGLMLIRGAFIPGLSALDSPGQIIAWAVIFGYAQQVFTRFADGQAEGVLSRVGTVDNAKAANVTIPADRPGPPTPRT